MPFVGVVTTAVPQTTNLHFHSTALRRRQSTLPEWCWRPRERWGGVNFADLETTPPPFLITKAALSHPRIHPGLSDRRGRSPRCRPRLAAAAPGGLLLSFERGLTRSQSLPIASCAILALSLRLTLSDHCLVRFALLFRVALSLFRRLESPLLLLQLPLKFLLRIGSLIGLETFDFFRVFALACKGNRK